VSCPLLRVNDFGSSPIELSSSKNNSSKTVNENQNPLVLEQEVQLRNSLLRHLEIQRINKHKKDPDYSVIN
jgi:hypothetical protein